MKRYLADILTLFRFILATMLIVFAIIGTKPEIGLIIFLLGELTDAFDGTCANKWPFPKNQKPKYRKYAVKYDMIADAILCGAMLLFFVNQINTLAGLVIGISFAVFTIITDFVVYGKIMGHPDDFKKYSLSNHNFKLAKKIILFRRRLYILLMAVIVVWTILATSWSNITKVIIISILVLIGIFFWFFLSQRRHNISRDAVDIEKKLSK